MKPLFKCLEYFDLLPYQSINKYIGEKKNKLQLGYKA